MANPLDAFKNLKPWQQGAVAVGGAVVVGGFVLYERKQKSAAAAAGAAAVPSTSATGATSETVGDMVTDPTTGQTYPAGDVDPASGLTYGAEIQEYGSVAAADEAGAEAGDAAIEEGLTQTEYDEETGQAAGGSTASNAAWVAEVESALAELGYSSTDIQQGLARYFSGSPQGTAADGTDLYQMMDLAIGEYGPPPSGTYALVKGSGPAGPGAGSVTVPDEVGQTSLATAEAAVKAAGLVPLAAGDSSAGSKGKVTAQSPAAGSAVSKGSSVTLTYTVAAATVTVPDLAGHTAEEATSTLEAINLEPVNPKGTPGTSVVTSTSPPAGTKVAAKSKVTITSKPPVPAPAKGLAPKPK